MSLLTRVRPVTRASLTPVTRVSATTRPAFFSSTAQRQDRGPVDATKDTLKKADRLVSDAAVKGIETGEKATQKIKETLGREGEEAKAKGQEAARQAKKKKDEFEEEAKSAADDITGKA